MGKRETFRSLYRNTYNLKTEKRIRVSAVLTLRFTCQCSKRDGWVPGMVGCGVTEENRVSGSLFSVGSDQRELSAAPFSPWDEGRRSPLCTTLLSHRSWKRCGWLGAGQPGGKAPAGPLSPAAWPGERSDWVHTVWRPLGSDRG
ncbi:hypothetical protein HJG60_008552 [Phyllostomus discolor]|uniref:Uncharacterized protein n=1 Tax=Phyllostomus discolor TaxID=89673 RepID=A0A833YST9_9CHIR|nr:hypothetical protein HJG60_008552 [Phyllostomus discolor]